MASVLPNVNIPPIDLGLFELQPFGILVATGVLLGAHLVRKYGDKNELDQDILQGLIGWSVVGGFLGAHLFDVAFYQPGAVAEDPLILVKIWSGISSFGGMIGATVAWFLYFRVHHLEQSRLTYADPFALGFLPGLAFGRLGCTLVYDHPGIESDFFLAMDDQAGIARHNLGFYELLWCIVITVVLLRVAARWHKRPRGVIVAIACAMYGPVRFGLDFLRVGAADGGDQRYFGLTFAHYTSLALAATGFALLWYAFKHRYDPEPQPQLVPVREEAPEPMPRAVASKNKKKSKKGKKKRK
jgi:phosphatidylglycerol:prolipoprotein diacylglycerol transferase